MHWYKVEAGFVTQRTVYHGYAYNVALGEYTACKRRGEKVDLWEDDCIIKSYSAGYEVTRSIGHDKD